ncbi:MAG: hypothetical protein P3X22_005940 [Thermoprotei archaeon]|nr:hypothetical protein [Thermoprotei archaeon]
MRWALRLPPASFKTPLLALIVALLVIPALQTLAGAGGGKGLEVSFEPVKALIEGKTLPGDLYRVNVMLRADVQVSRAKTAYMILYVDPSNGLERTLDGGFLEILFKDGVGLGHVDFTVPWTPKVIVLFNVLEPGELEGLSATLELPVSPEVRVEVRGLRPLMEAFEGGWLILPVTLRSNFFEGYGTIIVRDKTLNVELKRVNVNVKGTITHDVYVQLPENPRRLYIFKEWSMVHAIEVIYEGPDTYPDNNREIIFVNVKLKEEVWRVPAAVIIALAGIAVIAALLAFAGRIVFG